MKQIVYLLLLLLCFAGCKKRENDPMIRFARITFQNETKWTRSPYILYDERKNGVNAAFPVTLGDKKFTICNANGEKLIDTVLVVDKDQKYYIVQRDTTKAAVLTRIAPPPPVVDPGNNDPFNGVSAAKEGYVKFQIRYDASLVFPTNGIDMVMYALSYDSNKQLISTPVATLSGVHYGFNRGYYEVKRGDDGGVPVRLYRFSFVNKETGEPIKNSFGKVYEGGFIELNKMAFNLYKIGLYDYEVTSEEQKKNAIEIDGKFYIVEAEMLNQK